MKLSGGNTHKPMNTYLIIDFDSTFITGESLDWLAEEVLKNLPSDKQKRMQSLIEEITRRGMEGEITFTDSLRQRLSLFRPNKSQIQNLVKRIEKSVTPSFERNKEYIRQNAEQIHIVSGGFHEYMDQVLMSFGLFEEHIHANSFIFTGDEVVSFDPDNRLSMPDGKSKVVSTLNLNGQVVVIGDGYTDFEIVKSGSGDIFIAFTENIARDFVQNHHVLEVSSFDGVLSHLSML